MGQSLDKHEKDPVPALSEHLAEGVRKRQSLHRVRQQPIWVTKGGRANSRKIKVRKRALEDILACKPLFTV